MDFKTALEKLSSQGKIIKYVKKYFTTKRICKY